MWEKEVESLWKKYRGFESEPSPCRPLPQPHISQGVAAYTIPDTSVPENLQIPHDLTSL